MKKEFLLLLTMFFLAQIAVLGQKYAAILVSILQIINLLRAIMLLKQFFSGRLKVNCIAKTW
jgi:hypothetical protein